MPVQETDESRELARQMKEEGVEMCAFCEHWDQHGPTRGQCAESGFIVYKGPGPERHYSMERFKVATEYDWSCPKFERRPIE